ncbi:hypothetical protein N752_02915 [Desulforamulus aquiferis]|nr:hypothetical protein [Desulforamulus aquiferis]RYD06638.1 hypothetical protein N752_02915 [Desulforamulus aquiferis]
MGQVNAIKQQSEKYIYEYRAVKSVLERLGYIKEREFFPRGNFALELHVQEILVTELAFSGMLEDLPPEEVAGILAGVDYIPGRREFVPAPPYDPTPVHELRSNCWKRRSLPTSLFGPARLDLLPMPGTLEKV